MMLVRWREEPVARHHRRAHFDCGQVDLNTFIAKYARQAHESSASKTYVAVDPQHPLEILGFYTLCPAQVRFQDVHKELRVAGAGKHPIGCFRLAKLAVSRSFQGQGLGGSLLASAIERCALAAAQVGGAFLLIDAKDAVAMNWYRSYGAVALPDIPLSLVLPYANFLKRLKPQAP